MIKVLKEKLTLIKRKDMKKLGLLPKKNDLLKTGRKVAEASYEELLRKI
jgi:hypothetical protein